VNVQEERAFQAEIDTMGLEQKEHIMQVMTSWEEKAQRSLIVKQLNRKLGELSESLIDRLERLSGEQVASLGEALLDFGSIDDLTAWLTNQG
jgi:heme oxygenase